jgi:putative inorganic carbon (hco3(-)) transporter
MLRSLLVFIVLGAGILAAIMNRFAALLLYVWFALFRPQEFVWYDISGLRLSVAVGLLLVVPSLLTGVLPNVTHPLSVGSILFLLSAAGAHFGAHNSDVSWLRLTDFARLILVSLLAVTLTSTPKRFVLLLGVIAGSFGFYSAKAGLASLMGGGVQYFEGLAGAFSDNNGYALGITMIIPLLVATAQNLSILEAAPGSAWKPWVRRGLLLAVPLSALTVVSTFSRGGLLALAASVSVFLGLQQRRLRVVAALALAVIVVVPFIPLPQGYFERVRTIQTYEQTAEDSATGRLHFWRVAIDMAVDRPFGVGLFNYETEYDRYDSLDGRYGRQRSVHSSYLQALAETGFFGATVYVLTFLAALGIAFNCRRRARTEKLPPDFQRLLLTASNGLIASMVAFMVGGAFLAAALNDLSWLTFALVAALDRMSRDWVDTLTIRQATSGA